MPALRYWNGSTYVLLGAGGPPGPTGPTGPPGAGYGTVPTEYWKSSSAATASTAYSTTGTFVQDTTVPNLAITARANVWYRVVFVGRAMADTNGTTMDVAVMDGGASAPTAASPQVAVGSIYLPVASGVGATQMVVHMDVQFTAGTHTLGVFFRRTAPATVNGVALAAASGQTKDLTVFNPAFTGAAGPTGPAGPAGGGSVIVSVRATQTAAVNVTTVGATMPFNSEQWDTQNAFNAATGQFTCPVAGKYRVGAQVAASATSTLQWVGVNVQKNGVTQGSQSVWNPSTGNTQAQCVDTVDCAVGDVISIQAYGSQTMAVYVTGITWLTIDLLSGTGPQGPPGPTGPPAGYMSLLYYQTIPRPTVASSPYTLTHNLGTTFLLVDVWDAVTNQKVNVQVQTFDVNRLGIYVAQDMPNPVNVVVMGTALTPTPIAAGDLATKAYVDAKTATLPAPVTSGSTVQSFTDALGDVWIAKNGVSGGNWVRANQMVARAVLGNAGTPSGLTPFPITLPATLDPWGCFSTSVFTCAVAGTYLVTTHMQVQSVPASNAPGLHLQKNNVDIAVVTFFATTSYTYQFPVTDITAMVPGDTIRAAVGNSGGTGTGGSIYIARIAN
jgi:hypothetical protein